MVSTGSDLRSPIAGRGGKAGFGFGDRSGKMLEFEDVESKSGSGISVELVWKRKKKKEIR